MSVSHQIGLIDITDPSPVSQIPAIGWWLAGIFAIVVLVGCIFAAVKFYHRKQRLKRSLTALEKVWSEYQRTQSNSNICDQLNVVIKRHLAQSGQYHTLNMSGSAWKSYLCGYINSRYHSELSEFLDQLYRPGSQDSDRNQFWYNQVRNWLKSLPC